MNTEEIYEAAFNDELEKSAGVGGFIKKLFSKGPKKPSAVERSRILLKKMKGMESDMKESAHVQKTTDIIGNNISSMLKNR